MIKAEIMGSFGPPNENHNNYILYQMPDFYITSPKKLMDDIFESLTNLFVDRMIKK